MSIAPIGIRSQNADSPKMSACSTPKNSDTPIVLAVCMAIESLALLSFL